MNKAKIGRNDSCYCGSGKKYKKCCLDADVDAKQAYEPTELMDRSMEYLQHSFPMLNFINVTDLLNAQSYPKLQIKHMRDNVCQVAERIKKNERVFKDRNPDDHGYDLLLMYRGAYRILHGGHNIQQYTMSLSSFFTCPSQPSCKSKEEEEEKKDTQIEITHRENDCSEDDEEY